MSSKGHVKIFLSLLLFVAAFVSVESGVFDVTKYGGKADGRTDITKALANAWKDACALDSHSKVWIPRGTYVCGVVTMAGPCKSTVDFQLEGTLKAPVGLSGDSWITFEYINRLMIYGGGTFDGHGQTAWTTNNCNQDANCQAFPFNLRFNFVDNTMVRDITSRDSKNFHVNILGCKNITFYHFTINAPQTSINTDGIHIGKSNGVNISNTNIATGDDCISIGDGSQQINIFGVRCGPGHGISIGSLGRYANEEPVKGIYVRSCNFYGTENGVRIKSWPAMHGGSASDMHFEDITMNNVKNPILIDQMYCPYDQCSRQAPSKVKINNVSFKNIRGTSGTAKVVQLICSSGNPCQNVELNNIDLAYQGNEGPIKSECQNVKPMMSGKFPAGC